MTYFVFGVLFTVTVLGSLAAVHAVSRGKEESTVHLNIPLLIAQFNSGHLGIDAADQLAKSGYRLELDKAHKVTAIVKDTF